MKVVVGMVVLQVATAGMTILYKISVDRGMSLRVLIAYRYIFGAALLLFSWRGSPERGNLALGSLLATASTLCMAIWFIIQAKMSEKYPHPYTSTAIVNLVAAVQCTCIAAITERDASAWKLRWDINLFTALYVGW
ncbi:WAT1-related protein [Nymphaea thermarum]|nr:WAT1-related protein [Nymphaea thermarum]